MDIKALRAIEVFKKLLCCFYNHVVKLPALPRLFKCPICNIQNYKLHINNQAVKWVLQKSAENRCGTLALKKYSQLDFTKDSE
jgi:hypothetical protein